MGLDFNFNALPSDESLGYYHRVPSGTKTIDDFYKRFISFFIRYNLLFNFRGNAGD